MAKLGCTLILALFAISGTVSLNCYRCSGAQNLQKCSAVESCADGQVCYKKRQYTKDVQFDLGCIDSEKCGEFAKMRNASEIAKMSADQTSYCFECCSTNKCNKDKCDYPPHYLCKDSESHDCAQLNSMFSICKITKEAKKICPKFCKLCDLVDGKWSLWSPWSSCNVTCGKGTLSRYRLCNNPAPQNGGLDCPGKRTELKTCILKLCPVHGGWSLWENWGKCSATCGVGMRNRKRSCTNPRPQRFGDHCFGDSNDDELCNSKSCTVIGGWNDWTQWGQCSVTCGIGLQSRSRSCTNPTPMNAGQNCVGQNLDVNLCYQKLCPGKWADWQPWSRCSGSCGRKVQTRKRTCSNKQIIMECEGNALETRTCPLVNVALGKRSEQINIFNNPDQWGPHNGNDGDSSSDTKWNSCFHTLHSTNPWWKVDLVDVYCIRQVNITNVSTSCCVDRAQNVEISVAKEQDRWSVVAYRQGPMGKFYSALFNPVEARYVRVSLRNTKNYLHFCEVEVFGCN